jgi:hypothetical protein
MLAMHVLSYGSQKQSHFRSSAAGRRRRRASGTRRVACGARPGPRISDRKRTPARLGGSLVVPTGSERLRGSAGASHSRIQSTTNYPTISLARRRGVESEGDALKRKPGRCPGLVCGCHFVATEHNATECKRMRSSFVTCQVACTCVSSH